MSRQFGFTLLEVLIATVLLAVMMGLLMGGMRVGADSWGQGERLAERASRLLVVDNFLRSHLSDAKPLFDLPSDPALAGMPPALVFNGGPAFLEYAGTLPPQVRGGLYKFRLRLAQEDGRSDLKLSMRPFSTGQGGGEAPIEDVLVLEDVASLRIAYYKKAPGEAEPRWLDEWKEGFLPSLIRIDIEVRGEPPWPPIFVAPRAEVG